jgi:thioredoxin-related protein
MKLVIPFLLFLNFAFIIPIPDWGHNYNDALQKAQKENKFILVNFSGSDWCGPCIRLHKEVFLMTDFIKVATEKLVLLNADFPRAKKNQLPAAQQKLNDDLAEKYNSKGVFPLTVLVDQNGKVIKSWEGFPASPNEFIDDIKQAIQDHQ